LNDVLGEGQLGLREAKKDRTRSLFLEAALELIRKQGFEQTTVNDIAAVVQVSPRTLLRYFPTKEDVIVWWFDEGMSILREGVKTRLPTHTHPDALRAAAREMLAAYEKRAEFYLVIERVVAASPQVSARRQQMIESLTREISAMLTRHRKPTNRQVAMICDVYTGTVFALIRASVRAWVATNGSKSLVAFFDDAITTVKFAETGPVAGRVTPMPNGRPRRRQVKALATETNLTPST
jgi:AcrR family transcriptional regulator